MGECPVPKTNDTRSFLVGWLAGAAMSYVLPGILCLTLLLPACLNREIQPVEVLVALSWLSLIFVAPGLGAAAVGGALGLRRWLAAAVCFPVAVAFALACWRFAYGPGALKVMALLLPFAVVNAIFAAVAAGKVARDRRAGK
jgi:hypothetical protein